MPDVRRDNTGAGRFDEGLALPTTAFPSDHAIVSAAVRLCPAAALGAHAAAAEDVAAACIEAGEVRDTTAAALDGDGTAAGIAGGTLYDYWGIAELPPALSQVAPALPAAEGDAAGVGGRRDKPDGRQQTPPPPCPGGRKAWRGSVGAKRNARPAGAGGGRSTARQHATASSSGATARAARSATNHGWHSAADSGRGLKSTHTARSPAPHARRSSSPALDPRR